MEAITEMKAQVGDLESDSGVAGKGLLIRHLVLPGGLAGTKKVLGWIRDELGPQTAISLMSQYYPVCRADDYPIINRRIRNDEYEPLIRFLQEEGFDNAFVQELESAEVLLPDFRRQKPY
jgi:putative pyruvate formate lyase activating enzyme